MQSHLPPDETVGVRETRRLRRFEKRRTLFVYSADSSFALMLMLNTPDNPAPPLKRIGLAIAAIAFFLLFALPNLRPVPSSFQQADGPVEQATIVAVSHFRRASSFDLHFSLTNGSNVFVCPAWLLRDNAMSRMQPGTHVKVLFTTSYLGRPKVWGLTADDTVLLEPADVEEQRKSWAEIYALIAFFLGLTALFPNVRKSDG
jgi:hypothetical protein